MPHLSRDSRHAILVLANDALLSRKDIAARLGVTERQVGYATRAGHPTPKKKTGRRPLLSEEEEEELVAFVCASRKNRRLTFIQIADLKLFGEGIGYKAIKNALERQGFHRSEFRHQS